MKAIVVGTGAGGATIARELASNGFEVIIFEAGKPFKPLRKVLSVSSPFRRLGLFGNEKIITKIFPHMDTIRSADDLVLVRGLTTGGSTSISCGNIVPAEYGLKRIGLNLDSEFDEIEESIGLNEFPFEKWRPVTQDMFESAQDLGLNPKITPKCINPNKCIYCGLCELGCTTGARWDSQDFLNDAINDGAILYTSSPVEKVIIENDQVKGVVVRNKGKLKSFKADIVVIAAGGVGTSQILKASGLQAEDKLWVDIVLTLGGVLKGANQINEPPMLWYSKQKDYIISPYPDILSHWFHKPWKNVSISDRVGIMVKLADVEDGKVFKDGSVQKSINKNDYFRLDGAIDKVKEIMESAGVSGHYINGMYNGGHLGGTVPLKKEDTDLMKPSWLPEGLWVADLSLSPNSQGLPTILLTAAMALKVGRSIVENYK